MYEPSTALGRVLAPIAEISAPGYSANSARASSGSRFTCANSASDCRSPSSPGRTSKRREQFLPPTPSEIATEVV